MSSSEQTGAKKRDYWWTVLAIDPLAVPLTRWIARRKLLTADQVTVLSALPGIAMGASFATATRTGLIVGGILFYVSFLLDCIDGKLARALGTLNPKGKTLDEMADGARRAAGSIGLAIALFRAAQPDGSDGRFWWAIAYGLLAFYFAVLSGGTRPEPQTKVGSRWSESLARHRLLPTPGTPDIAALVFFFGPLFDVVYPTLIVGCSLLAVGILLLIMRLFRR